MVAQILAAFYLSVCTLTHSTSTLLPDIPTTPVLRVDLSNLNAADKVATIKQHLQHSTEPVVFLHSRTAEWDAIEKWKSTNYLSTMFDNKLLNVKVAGTPVFTLYALDSKRPNEMLLQGGTQETVRMYQYEEMSLPTLFQDPSETGKYAYYSGELPHDMQKDVHLHELVVDHVSHNMSRGILWIGNRGTTAQVHYDRSINMFAQIVGQKRFYLYAPENWRHLYLHPSFSGSRRQCRYKFSLSEDYEEYQYSPAATGENVSETCGQKKAISATLSPGELLYVPPFYFHTVVSLSKKTMSYSVLSPSSEEFHYSSALYARVDFQNLGKPGTRKHRLGVKLYIDKILSALDQTNVIRSLYDSRHGPMNGVGISRLPDENDHAVDALWCTFSSKLERYRVEKLLGKRKLQQAVKNVKMVFQKSIKNVGATEILLHDLIEELLVFATVAADGEERRVARALQYCWML